MAIRSPRYVIARYPELERYYCYGHDPLYAVDEFFCKQLRYFKPVAESAADSRGSHEYTFSHEIAAVSRPCPGLIRVITRHIYY